MIKIGDIKYNTFPIDKCNLAFQVKYVYLTPFKFHRCPICGSSLHLDRNYAIKVSKKECAKISGNWCEECSSLFCVDDFFVRHIHKIRLDVNTYILSEKFISGFDFKKTSTDFRHIKTALSQYIVSDKNGLKAFTIVSDMEDVDPEHGIISYNNGVAKLLDRAEMLNTPIVDIQYKEYIILHIKHNNIKANIKDVVANNRSFVSSSPALCSDTTVYIYKGKIQCHFKHHVCEYCAEIPFLNAESSHFFVEYCYDCDKFLMKYDDYESYLKEYKFFPANLRYYDNNSEYHDFNRAEKSPLYLCGYNVNSKKSLFKFERQNILASLMDYNIMSRRTILDYLEMFVITNKNRENMLAAVGKWEEDRKYVLNYKLDEKPRVVIYNIKPRS